MEGVLGYVLSGATTRIATFQLVEEAEKYLREGMFVIIEDKENRFIGYVVGIRKYHEFYEEGDIWSEAIRKRRKLPEGIAREYAVADVEILGILSERGLKSSDKPPSPGAPVLQLDLKSIKLLYGFDPNLSPPEMITIGHLYGYSENLPIFLNLKNITMHMAILGVTGSGKSNTVGVIIEELGKKRMLSKNFTTIPIIVIDANGDYIDFYEDPSLVPAYDSVIRYIFHGSMIFNRFLEGQEYVTAKSELKPIYLDLNDLSPYELAYLIINFYHGGKIEGAELQISYLSIILSRLEAIANLIPQATTREGIDFNKVFGNKDAYLALRNMLITATRVRGSREAVEIRRILGIHGIHTTTLQAIIRALDVFSEKIVETYRLIPPSRDQATISKKNLFGILNPLKPKLAILDFSADGATGVSLDVKQIVIYYITKILFEIFVEAKTKGRKMIGLLIVEEAQNYAPNLKFYPIRLHLARDVLATIATQGRKFGLSLLLVTQRPSYVDPVIMSMVNTFIIHRVAQADISFLDKVTGGLQKHLRSRLVLMERGLAIVLGQMSLFSYPLLAQIRRRIRHISGAVEFI